MCPEQSPWKLLAIAWAAVAFSRGAAAQVSGRVLDAATGETVGDALVSLPAAGVRTTTGPEGRFELPAAAGAKLTVTAAKKGYFTSSAAAVSPAGDLELRLERVPPDDDRTYRFRDPEACGLCHQDQLAQWKGSPMAVAGENTWVYDLYDGTGTAGGLGGFVYKRDSAHAAASPGSDCAACHQPEPWVREPLRALEDLRSLSEEALHGVSCEVCHKVADVDETKVSFPGIYPGAVTFTLPRGPDYRAVQYGVLGDADFQYSIFMRASYQPQLTALLCAACHQDVNDHDDDGDFEEEEGVVSEPTYLEWLESPYGDPASPLHATCVDCHMPAYGARQACTAILPPLTRDPETIRSHRIEGTTPAFLESSVDLALRAEVAETAEAVETNGGRIEVRVSVTNSGTGHHVPTGVTIT
ncbi:MAG: hypothetical protein HY721_32725 [Planctomycetes bacterium]|nr:hypothetical protein [Planctomycetota bacterium]